MERCQRFDYDLSGSHGGIRANEARLTASYPLHRHDYPEGEIVVSGRGIHWLNGRAIPVSAGDFWGLGTDDFHKVDLAEDGKPLVVDSLKLARSEIGLALFELTAPAAFPFTGHLDGTLLERVQQIFRILFDTAAQRTPFADARFTGCAMMILSDLLDHAGTLLPAAEQGSAMAYVRRTIAYLTDHFREPVTLADAAEAVGVSPCYLSDVFARQAGCSVTAYRNRLRADHARRLLAATDCTVTEAANESGFGSLSAMNRRFLQEFGAAPRELRRLDREKNG